MPLASQILPAIMEGCRNVRCASPCHVAASSPPPPPMALRPMDEPVLLPLRKEAKAQGMKAKNMPAKAMLQGGGDAQTDLRDGEAVATRLQSSLLALCWATRGNRTAG